MDRYFKSGEYLKITEALPRPFGEMNKEEEADLDRLYIE